MSKQAVQESQLELLEALAHYDWERVQRLAAIQTAASPQEAFGWFALGIVAGKRDENLEVAQAHFKRAVDLEPLNAAYRFNYGLVLFDLGRQKEGLAQVSQAVQLEGLAEYRLHLAKILLIRGEHGEARGELEKVGVPDASLRSLYDELDARVSLAEILSTEWYPHPHNPQIRIPKNKHGLEMFELQVQRLKGMPHLSPELKAEVAQADAEIVQLRSLRYDGRPPVLVGGILVTLLLLIPNKPMTHVLSAIYGISVLVYWWTARSEAWEVMRKRLSEEPPAADPGTMMGRWLGEHGFETAWFGPFVPLFAAYHAGRSKFGGMGGDLTRHHCARCNERV